MADLGCEITDVGSPDVTCPASAPWALTSGCVHEHISTRRVCDRHRASLLIGAAVCGVCEDAGHYSRRYLIGGEVHA